MEVHFTPELEEMITNLSTQTGRPADELVQDVMAGYVYELAGVRDTLDARFDDIKSGRVKLIDGDEFFDGLRKREDDLLASRPR